MSQKPVPFLTLIYKIVIIYLSRLFVAIIKHNCNDNKYNGSYDDWLVLIPCPAFNIIFIVERAPLSNSIKRCKCAPLQATWAATFLIIYWLAFSWFTFSLLNLCWFAASCFTDRFFRYITTLISSISRNITLSIYRIIITKFSLIQFLINLIRWVRNRLIRALIRIILIELYYHLCNVMF